jgi:hypothetical protein
MNLITPFKPIQNPMRFYERLAIENCCQQWQITKLAVFGFVLRDDFRAERDIKYGVFAKQQASPDLPESIY